jgi:hypothetical protein
MATQRTNAICLLVSLYCLSLVANSASAKLVTPRDPRDAILDAELVVIVHQQAPGEFQVEEVFLGNAREGDSIVLPDFKLFTQQTHGPDIIDPITPDTRILLFLQHKKDAPQTWEPTYYGNSFFWVHDAQLLEQLRSTARFAVELRRTWQAADDIADPAQRVAALWTFLSWRDYGPNFFEHTNAELKKAAPAGGDLIAERLATMSPGDRSMLYKDAGDYGSEELHQALRNHLMLQLRLYEKAVSAWKLRPEDALANWNTLPGNVKDIYGEIYYGLAGLASFHDRSDLPDIREIARWAVQYHLEQTSEAALGAFRTMPDQANLPVISLIQEKFAIHAVENDTQSFNIELIRSLCTHKFPETVPILAPFVTDSFAGREAQAALADIAGQDLGDSPEPWLSWYRVKYETESVRP